MVTCHICGTQHTLQFASREQDFKLLTRECPACAGPIRFRPSPEVTIGVARGLLCAFTESEFYRSYYGDPCACLLQSCTTEEDIERVIAAAGGMDYDLWQDDNDRRSSGDSWLLRARSIRGLDALRLDGTPREFPGPWPHEEGPVLRAMAVRWLRARSLDGTLKESLRACSEAAKRALRDERKEHMKIYQSRLAGRGGSL